MSRTWPRLNHSCRNNLPSAAQGTPPAVTSLMKVWLPDMFAFFSPHRALLRLQTKLGLHWIVLLPPSLWTHYQGHLMLTWGSDSFRSWKHPKQSIPDLRRRKKRQRGSVVCPVLFQSSTKAWWTTCRMFYCVGKLFPYAIKVFPRFKMWPQINDATMWNVISAPNC